MYNVTSAHEHSLPQSDTTCKYGNCPEFLLRYLMYLEMNQGKRPLTLSENCMLLREFCQYVHYRNKIGEDPPIWDAHKDMNITCMDLSELAAVTRDDLERYIAFLNNLARNTPVTLSKKLSIIRTFYSYLLRMQNEMGVAFPHDNPAANLSVSVSRANQQVTITPKQMEMLINNVQEDTRLRDRSILLLLCTTGVTVSELINLKVSDYIDGNWLRIDGAKGVRYVWLTPACACALQRYLVAEDRYNSENPHIYQSLRKKGQPVTARTLRNLVSRAADNAQLSYLNITPKMLRDTVASILYANASNHQWANVYHYLGYQIPSSHRTGLDGRQHFAEDHTMMQLVETSPLGALGKGELEVMR